MGADKKLLYEIELNYKSFCDNTLDIFNANIIGMKELQRRIQWGMDMKIFLMIKAEQWHELFNQEPDIEFEPD